jgi:hypothetical protein
MAPLHLVLASSFFWCCSSSSSSRGAAIAVDTAGGARCPDGKPPGPLLPCAANASSCYQLDPSYRHVSLSGKWMSNGGPPQWVDFSLQLPSSGSAPVLLSRLEATGGACGQGNLTSATNIYACADDSPASCVLVYTCHGGPFASNRPVPVGMPGWGAAGKWGWTPAAPVKVHRILLNTTHLGGARANPAGCCAGWVSLDSLQFYVCGAKAIAPPPPPPPTPAPPASSFPRLIVVAANASASERYAAQTLATYLGTISGTSPWVVTNASAATETRPQLAVGFGAARALGVPASALVGLGEEGFVVSSVYPGLHASQAFLSGGPGAKRGTIYAVDAALEELGVLFLAFDATVVPTVLPVALPGWQLREKPAMMLRQAYNWESELDADFNTHLRLNKAVPHSDSWLPEIMDAKHGGSVYYAEPPGFVHTVMAVLSNGTTDSPPDMHDLWPTHREWFWPRDEVGPWQVCWSNASLQRYLLERSKDYLRRDPRASLISISQLDNSNYCQDPTESAIISAEQSPAGPMLRAINFIARGLESEFPAVRVDTLAYSYTQPAPVITRPRDNVVIRLCTSYFDKQLVESWANLTQNIFVWDYLTIFGAYLEPFPITLELPGNIELLANNGVTGYFGEMGFQGSGADMSELNAYLLSKLLWDPKADSDAVIATFLRNFYGETASVYIMEYLSLVHGEAVLNGYSPRSAIWSDVNVSPTGYLPPPVVLACAEAFENALAAAAAGGTPAEFVRVQQASMSIYWVTLNRWVELRNYAMVNKQPWPIEDTLNEAFVAFGLKYNATARRYGAVAHAGKSQNSNFTNGHGLIVAPNMGDSLTPGRGTPYAHSCSNPRNGSIHCAQLPLFQTKLFSRCPAALGGGLAEPVVPYSVNASSCYSRDPTLMKPALNGRWMSNGGAPAWLEFALVDPAASAAAAGVAVSMFRAVNGSAGGVYELHFDGDLVHRFSPKAADGPSQTLTWVNSKATASANALASLVRVVRVVTVAVGDGKGGVAPSGPGCCAGWAGWTAIQLLACKTDDDYAPPPARTEVAAAVPSLLVLGRNASATERYAAAVLSQHLAAATGRPVPIVTVGEVRSNASTLCSVGYQAAVGLGHIPAAKLDALAGSGGRGNDAFMIAVAAPVKTPRTVLNATHLGGAFTDSSPSFVALASFSGCIRGTANAAFAFLRACGFDFLAPGAIVPPQMPLTHMTLQTGATYDPPFSLRKRRPTPPPHFHGCTDFVCLCAVVCARCSSRKSSPSVVAAPTY